MKIYKLFALLMLLIIACEKNPTAIENTDTPAISLKGVLITNEGSFSAANASLSYYNPDSAKVFNNVFYSVNGQDLGSVANSITIHDTLAYIVVNNSDKIEVISINSFRRISTILLPAGSSPRNMVVAGNAKGYVTNLYKKNCSVIDLNSMQVAGSIPTGANPEGLVYANSKLYVANSGFGAGNTVSIISTQNDQLLDSLKVGDNPISITKDKDQFIYVLCSGSYGDWADPNDDTPGGVWKINPNSDSIVDSLIINGHPSRICITEEKYGYFINSGSISEFDCQTMQLVNDNLISGNFYGLNYDSLTQRIYALDPKDYFSQNGEMIIFDQTGNELERYEVGLIPGTVAFYSNK